MSILDVKLDSDNAANAVDIRDYLKTLLLKVWNEGEGFNSQRPFGSGAWEYDLYHALIVSGHVKGTLDEDGYVDTVDECKANQLIAEAISSL